MTVYFMLLFICLGISISIAKGSADALFLKRYGVENLAFVYLVLAVVLAMVCTVYAAYVDRVASEKFFGIIFLLQLFVLLFSWLGMNVVEYESIYPMYYVLYSLSSEMLLVHGAFYLGQNLDTLQSKRLTPVIFSGYQLGMVIGGLILIFVISDIGLNLAPIVWGGFTLLAFIMLVGWHGREGISPYYFSKGKSRINRFKVAINEIVKGFVFIRSMDLLRNASWALLFLVITFYLLSYSAYTIYSTSFESEQELTRFFGMLVVVTNLSAMMFQLFVSSRVIEKIGVRKAKLIYPVTTIISFIFLILHPGFLAAIFASFNRETIMPAFRNPAREMFFNVLPAHIKGRSRAISVAIVMPVALFFCGILIIIVQRIGSLEMVAWAGLILAGFYLLFCVRMGKSYLATLINSMREKLFLPEDKVDVYRAGGDSIFDELVEGLNRDNDEVSLSYARILAVCYPERAASIIIDRVCTAETIIADQLLNLAAECSPGDVRSQLNQILDIGDDHLKATVYATVFRMDSEDKKVIIVEALDNVNPRIRCAGITAAMNADDVKLFNKAITIWNILLEGDDEDVYAAFELIPCLRGIVEISLLEHLMHSYADLLSKYILTINEPRRITIYRHLMNWRSALPEQVMDKMIEDLNHFSPKVRAAAFHALKTLPESAPVTDMIWKGLNDGHQNVRNAALSLVKDGCKNEREEVFEWINTNSKGTPRAHKTLLEHLVKNGGTNTMLAQIAETKTRYAAELLSAVHQLEKDCSDNIYLILLRTLLEERFLQVVDLALLAVQPLLNSNAIAVIRVGIESRDSKYQSDALEALSCVDDSVVARQLGILVGGDNKKIKQVMTGKIFNNINDVIKWCINSNDSWIRENGITSQKAIGE